MLYRHGAASCYSLRCW